MHFYGALSLRNKVTNSVKNVMTNVDDISLTISLINVVSLNIQVGKNYIYAFSHYALSSRNKATISVKICTFCKFNIISLFILLKLLIIRFQIKVKDSFSFASTNTLIVICV